MAVTVNPAPMSPSRGWLIAEAILACTALLLFVCGLSATLVGPSPGRWLSLPAFLIVVVLLATNMFRLNFGPSACLADYYPSLKRLRSLLLRGIVACLISFVTSFLVLVPLSWDAGAADGTRPVFDRQAVYRLNNHGNFTVVSRTRYIAVGTTQVLTWHLGGFLALLHAFHWMLLGEVRSQAQSPQPANCGSPFRTDGAWTADTAKNQSDTRADVTLLRTFALDKSCEIVLSSDALWWRSRVWFQQPFQSVPLDKLALRVSRCGWTRLAFGLHFNHRSTLAPLVDFTPWNPARWVRRLESMGVTVNDPYRVARHPVRAFLGNTLFLLVLFALFGVYVSIPFDPDIRLLIVALCVAMTLAFAWMAD